MSRIPRTKEPVSHLVVDAEQQERRLDNFLRARFRDLPKSRVYQMIRKGEVRVNGGRAKPDYRLRSGDRVRLPPMSRAERPAAPALARGAVEAVSAAILYEDDELMVLNKPAGIAVHAGSGRPYGVIDILRKLRPDASGLQLVHRLDQETSGCLLLAKNHPGLRRLHALLRDGMIEKRYLALLKGHLADAAVTVDLPLRRSDGHGGRRRVESSAEGKAASSRFVLMRSFGNATLVRVELATGRTHQIRVHASLIGHPVAGDHRYGDREFNRGLRAAGLRRMFLHASRVRIPRSGSRRELIIDAPLPDDLQAFLAGYA